MLLLKQEDVQRMAYQTFGGVVFEYGDEKKLLKKFNRNIIRNYIFSALLGAAITTQAFLAARNPEIMKKILLADVLLVFGASVATVGYSIIQLIKAEKELKKDV
ncbi:hypothetical protein HDR59_05560 [bacterium]|nr:hypothetical protein [bacterium]